MKKSALRNPRSYLGILTVVLVFGTAIALGRFKFKNPERFPAVSPRFKLVDATTASKIDHTHEGYTLHTAFANIGPYFTAIGSSVAVVDFDNDGWPDIYFNNSAEGSFNRLYRNNHDGTFSEMAAQAGIADVNRPHPSTRAIFADLDNNGFKDLILISSCPRIFMNENGRRFSETTQQSKLGCGQIYGGSNVIDVDNDGYLDLVLAPFLSADVIHDGSNLRVMQDSFSQATNGQAVSVFRNDRKGRFSPLPGNLGIRHRGWTHNVGAYDLRGTGRADLWFATDYSTDHLYLNQGGGKFTDASDKLVSNNFSRNGMSVDFADIDDDGHPVAIVSHIFEHGQKLAGNLLWKWKGGTDFEDVSRERKVHNCGWAWGAKFVDLDNDSHLDIYMGNGYISASKEKNYWYPLSVLDASTRSFMENAANWPPLKDMSLGGYQSPCVFVNQGGSFVNAAYALGLDTDRSNERGVALIDFLNNGSLSIVVSNQKQPARLYRNVQYNNNKWIGFKLTGTLSNRDAIGAKIILSLGDRRLERQLQPLNGYASQSDDRIHFGLGMDPKITSAEVRWPSGIVQKLNPSTLPLNHYHPITESRIR